MRPCRIILVSPPETNRNCQFIEISTECNCNRNKNSLTYIQETLNLNCVMKEYHVRCQIRKFRDAVKCCQLFNFFKNHFCEHYFYIQWRLTSNQKLFSTLTKVFSYIIYLRECEKCVYYLTGIYCYILFSSVIYNVNKIHGSFDIKFVLCFMVQLCLPKKLIEQKSHISIYQIISEKLRVVHPLSIWITTSPKKYRSKLFTNKNIPNTYNIF